MPDFNAVLILGHFIVSIFNVPLGNPVYQFIPFPNMEICQQYTQYHAMPQGYQVSMEYKMYKTAQCVTREEFEAQMEKQRQQMQPQPEQEDQDQHKPLTPGWELK